jgi:UDP:flavonoid glycosyltransferase YjiC (YdhE family)
VGIADVLRSRGHECIFIVEESFAGTLEAQGFEERLIRLSPPAEVEEVPGQFWKEFIRDTAPVFRKPTLRQLEEFIAPTFAALCDGARYVDDRLLEIIDELDPAVIVEVNVVAFPALPACGRPWVRVVSCNPSEMHDPDVPPAFSGYPATDRTGWAEYWEEYARVHGEAHASFSAFCEERGAPPLPPLDFIHESPWLNMYFYPEEADFRRARPLNGTWLNLETSVRATDAAWSVPESFNGRSDGALVYQSLGSPGAADVELMKGLVASLADTPHRIIVSKGPQHELIELADNMVGEEFLPQTSILPLVDAIVTHGGNNTTTESLYFGKPTVLLPLFWDQYDNAQRMDELGFGIRLSTYGHTGDELRGALDSLLADSALASRLAAISSRLQRKPGTVIAADAIERILS